MTVMYHVEKENGQCITEWETRVTERIGNKLYYHYEGRFFPTIMVNTATREDWKKADYPDEDCNSFQTTIWLLDSSKWSRELALRIANDILEAGVAVIPPACSGIKIKASEKHRIKKSTLKLVTDNFDLH